MTIFMFKNQDQIPYFCININKKNMIRSARLLASFSNKKVDYSMPHPTYTKEQLADVKIEHREPLTFGDKFAHFSI